MAFFGIVTIEEKISRLMSAIAEGIPASEVSKVIADLSEKKKRLIELGNVKPPKPILVEDMQRQARELRERLEGSDDAQKRKVLHKFLRGIIVEKRYL